MLIKRTFLFVIAVFIGLLVSPSYGGDIISCDSFENCPDGSLPLTSALLALEARIEALEAQNAVLQSQLAANEAADASAHHTKYTNANAIAAVGPHSPDFSTLLANVSRGTDSNTKQDTLTFTSMNVRIVNGSGTTNGSTTGTGNLIIGYNERRPLGTDNDRSGSHMLILGARNNYTAQSYGGMVGGENNETSAAYASVSGGKYNTASGYNATVVGGLNNTASASVATVSGGRTNAASADYASVSGGFGNTASFIYASVSGGYGNIASDHSASVSGGYKNVASENYASISGGNSKSAGSIYCVVGDNGVDC